MLKGKVAVVTGSTSGIGLGIARALASAGADVLLNGFGPREQIDALCSELAKGGIRAAYSPADMSKADEIEAMIAFATRELGRVDIVVNNAGIQHTAPVEEFPVDRWDAIIAINLSAAFHAIRAALPQMKTRGWGRIINISSVHGLVASSNKAAYVAAKHGLIGLTRTAALETAQAKVRINCVGPGYIETPFIMSRGPEVLAGYRAKHPMNKLGTPQNIAEVVAFLLSDRASFTTGSYYTADGGYTIFYVAYTRVGAIRDRSACLYSDSDNVVENHDLPNGND